MTLRSSAEVNSHGLKDGIISSMPPLLLTSIFVVLLGFCIINAAGFIPIIIYYLLMFLWFYFAEAPLFPEFIGLSVLAPLTPIILALCICTSCLLIVPRSHRHKGTHSLLVFAIVASLISSFLLGFGNIFNIDNKYSFNIFLSCIVLIICIFFLMQTANHYLKKYNNFFAIWIGFVLVGNILTFFFITGILDHYFINAHADKIVLFPQFIAVFIGVVISIKAENSRILAKHAQKNQRTASLLTVQKNKKSSDHSRLLRVIEREREIMEELRARESERTEEMRNAKIIADEANQAKSAFLAVVSHEIRTPMTGVMGMVKMLEDTPLSDEQRDYVMTIGDSGQAMVSLLNDILDFSKIEEGSMDIENIEFDLRRVLNSVTMLMKAHSDQKNLQLILNIDDGIPKTLYGDPTRLRQVILNLVGNALKFTSKGYVSIIANYKVINGQPNNIVFEVSDTGLGISREAQEKLFTPFSQADNSISRKYGGTGLGLAICKTLVEAMGGQITLRSREGAGSTFSFSLPLTSNNIQKTTEIGIESFISSPKDMRFLVVDDNEINRKVIDGFLKKYNHSTVLLENGKDVLEHLETDKQFDALFLDIEMPEMSGIDLAQHIKDNDTTNHLPLIAITGNVNDADISRYKNAGFSDHVAKPIDPNDLNLAIQQLSNPSENTTVIDSEASQKIKITPSKKVQEKKKHRPAVGKTLDEVMLKGLKEGLGSKQTNELIAELFIKADEIVGQLNDLKATQDKDSARMRAHELRGMAGNFGLKALSDKSEEIEQICKDNERPFSDIIPHIEDLSTLVERSRYSVKEFLGA